MEIPLDDFNVRNLTPMSWEWDGFQVYVLQGRPYKMESSDTTITLTVFVRSLNNNMCLKRQSKNIFAVNKYTLIERTEIVQIYIKNNRTTVNFSRVMITDFYMLILSWKYGALLVSTKRSTQLVPQSIFLKLLLPARFISTSSDLNCQRLQPNINRVRYSDARCHRKYRKTSTLNHSSQSAHLHDIIFKQWCDRISLVNWIIF